MHNCLLCLSLILLVAINLVQIHSTYIVNTDLGWWSYLWFSPPFIFLVMQLALCICIASSISKSTGTFRKSARGYQGGFWCCSFFIQTWMIVFFSIIYAGSSLAHWTMCLTFFKLIFCQWKSFCIKLHYLFLAERDSGS